MRNVLFLTTILATYGLAGCVDGPAPAVENIQEISAEMTAEDGGWDLAHFGVDNDPFLGNESAPVQVIAYEAPGCPSCARYHEANYPEVKADFIETGLIGYHYLQWSVGYDYDVTAGIAEECVFAAGGSEAYEAMLDKVFENRTSSGGNEDVLRTIIAEMAADFDFEADGALECFENEGTREELESDFAGGARSGAGSNPGFAILGPNGHLELAGGSLGPYKAIERALEMVAEAEAAAESDEESTGSDGDSNSG